VNRTKIEWVKNPDGSQGYTWNPITGCLNGCPYCYASKLANGRLKERYLANTNLAPDAKGGVSKLSISGQVAIEREGDYADPFYPRFWGNRVDAFMCIMPTFHYRTGFAYKDYGIFVCDMGELFGDWIPRDWQEQIFEAIRWNSNHRFYLLTKQPQNLIKFSPFPDNCFVGVTATNDLMSIDASNYLATIQAEIKFISFEPLLQWNLGASDTEKILGGINWLIIGAQTKPYKPPEIEWVREIVEAADRAGIPVFLKDNLAPLLSNEGWKGKPSQRLTRAHQALLRQEMPSIPSE